MLISKVSKFIAISTCLTTSMFGAIDHPVTDEGELETALGAAATGDSITFQNSFSLSSILRPANSNDSFVTTSNELFINGASKTH